MPPRYHPEEDSLTLSATDLAAGHRTPRPAGGHPGQRAEAGRQAHARQQHLRASQRQDYRAEVPLEWSFELDGADIRLQGRLDGLWQEGDVTVVEEVKSSLLGRGLPRHAHTVQMQVYLWMLRETGHEEVAGRLTYALGDGSARSYDFEPDPEMKRQFRERIGRIVRHARSEAARLRERAGRTGEIGWPFPERREGQPEIEEAVEGALRRGQTLLLEAPTGLGKTAPILLAALRHAAAGQARLLIATSRTAQQEDRLALLDTLAKPDALGRVMLLGSRERLGDEPGAALLDELPDPWAPPGWMLEALDGPGAVTPETTSRLARERGLPAGLLQREMARHADVIVGDQNLLANPDASLHRQNDPRPTVLLVDEAHGLPDRQRGQDASALKLRPLRKLAGSLENRGEQRLASALDELGDRLESALTPADTEIESAPREPFDPWTLALPEAAEYAAAEIAMLPEAGELLTGLMAALRRLAARTEGVVDYLDRTELSWRRERVDSGVRLIDVWDRCSAGVAFSGTLTPADHFSEELGLPPERADTLVLPDLSDRHLRPVFRHGGLRTTYHQREPCAPELAGLLEGLAKATGGRWIVFFPSRAYLELIDDALGKTAVQRSALRPGMPGKLLERMSSSLSGPSLLLALLGGTAGEGVDLPEGAFDGCVIVSPGVPPPSPRSELLRAFYESRGRDGTLFAQVLPGLLRVRQAAGRLWRGPGRRGALVLVGQRFADPAVEELLPHTWSMREPFLTSGEVVGAVTHWWTT
jgi:DNA excision repair protein ERCC-2